MATLERYTAVGVFDDRQQAHQAMEELQKAGFQHSEIGYAGPHGEGTSNETETAVERGGVAGVLTGGAIGSIVGIALAAGLIPGIGPVIAGGILAGVVASTAAGVVAGGLLGTLIALGIPEAEARFYEQELRSGRILITVKADKRLNQALVIIERHGGYNARSPRQVSNVV